MLSHSKLNQSQASELPLIQVNEFLPPISNWLKISGIAVVGMVGISLAATSVMRYKVTVRGEAVVRPVGDIRLVQAAAEGTVSQILVKEHHAVKSGDVIAILNTSALKMKKVQLQSSIQQTRLQIQHINGQISALNTQIAAEGDRIRRSVSVAQAGLQGRQRDLQDRQITAIAAVQEAENSLRAAEAALEAARSKRDRYHAIAESGALSKDHLEEAQSVFRQQAQAVAAAEATLVRARVALNPTNSEVAIASEQVALEQASGQAHLAGLKREQQSLIQQRIEMNKQLEHSTQELQQIDLQLEQTSITATADGIITKLTLRNPGQMVHSGEQIAQIVPDGTPLEIKAMISPQDVDKVADGQVVQMRVSACPHPDYGVLKGHVSHISKDSIKPDTSGLNPSTSAGVRQSAELPSFYEVVIQPEALVLGRGQYLCNLQPGMEGRVDIVTREETVLRFLLRKARLTADI